MDIETINKIPTLEEYKCLRSSVGWKLIDETAVTRGINSSIYSILAKVGDKTVGMGRIVGDEGIIYLLADVIVLPEFQGQGVGKAIVQKLMGWIEENCARGSLVWLFAAEGREGFYERFGFEKRPSMGFGAGMQWIWGNVND